MVEFTDASHNILFSLKRERWMSDFKRSGRSEITGYQEVDGDGARNALSDFCKAQRRGLYHPMHCGNPISWRSSAFTQVILPDGSPAQGVHDSHRSALAMGIKVKFNGPRDFTWVGLKHLLTGKLVLRLNVHPVAEGTSPESHPSNDTPNPTVARWKDWAVGQYWLDVIAFVAEQMSIQEQGNTTTASFWDVILLGGDYNAALDNRRRWYYPGALLPALFEQDAKFLAGLDHLQHGHGSDVGVVERWRQPGYTDHPIHFVKRRFTNVPDFPRER